ncbi:hypothetical protein GCM10027061_00430 [Nesterenkonia suensis]
MTALHLMEEQALRHDGTAGGGTAPGRHAVCRLEDLEPLWGEAALIGREQIALIRVPGDRVYAVSQWDPFAKAHVMARGIVGTKGGRPTLASPIHKQIYDLETGGCLSEEGLTLPVFAVDVDADGVVHVTV